MPLGDSNRGSGVREPTGTPAIEQKPGHLQAGSEGLRVLEEPSRGCVHRCPSAAGAQGRKAPIVAFPLLGQN